MLVSWDSQTHSYWSTAVAPFKGGGYDAEGGEKLRALVSPTRDRTSWTHQPFTHPPSPPLQSSYGGGHWQRLVDNWNLPQSIKSNYPEQDFLKILQRGVVFLCFKHVRLFFRNILTCLCPHIQPLFPPLSLLMDNCNAAVFWVGVCVEAKALPGSLLIL